MDKHLNDEDLAKVVGSGDLIGPETARRLLDAPSGSRPRIYGYLRSGESAGQVVALRSEFYLGRHERDLQAIWLSNTTLADLIQKA